MIKNWLVTGDTHGQVLERLSHIGYPPDETALIILGDMGLNFYLIRPTGRTRGMSMQLDSAFTRFAETMKSVQKIFPWSKCMTKTSMAASIMSQNFRISDTFLTERVTTFMTTLFLSSAERIP